MPALACGRLSKTPNDVTPARPSSVNTSTYPTSTRTIIDGIALPGGDGPRQLKIFFERQTNGAPRYPRCEQVTAVLEKSYGKPAKTEEFDEERSRNRRMTWTRGDEALSLACFRRGAESFFAEALTITAGRQLP